MRTGHSKGLANDTSRSSAYGLPTKCIFHGLVNLAMMVKNDVRDIDLSFILICTNFATMEYEGINFLLADCDMCSGADNCVSQSEHQSEFL